MLDRRHFLIGAGALLTASFVSRANAFSRKAGEPLVLSSGQKAGGDPLCLPAGYAVDENDEVADYGGEVARVARA